MSRFLAEKNSRENFPSHFSRFALSGDPLEPLHWPGKMFVTRTRRRHPHDACVCGCGGDGELRLYGQDMGWTPWRVLAHPVAPRG